MATSKKFQTINKPQLIRQKTPAHYLIRQLAAPFTQTIPHEQHRAQHLLLLLQFNISLGFTSF